MNFEHFKEKYAAGLTAQQLAAVTAPEGPTLLLAVPGSGKTRVLVTRVGYLILCKGVDPSRILTITYTVSATEDMKQRFADIFGEALAEKLAFRTINGICASIINFYARQIGRTPLRLVENEKKTNSLLSAIFFNIEHTYPTESDLKSVRTRISYIKNMLLSREEIREQNGQEEFHIAEIYFAYCDAMKQQGLMDFDDQLRYALSILRQSPKTLAYYQQQYLWLCVDEAQDTSRIQHVITACLSGKSRNLFMVGDEDQSIYGFRAAYPQALLAFEEHYPGANILLMETNFRSRKAIVEEADRFIAKNLLRREKHMIAASEETADTDKAVQKLVLHTRRDQYTFLLKEARKRNAKREAEDRMPQMAVLYRENESALPLIDLLEREGVPYRMKSGDWTFFSHRTVLDIRSFLAYAMNPRDEEAFLQIYYKMDLYLSKTAVQDAIAASRLEGRTVFEILIASREEPEFKKARYRGAWFFLRKIRQMKPQEAIQTIMGELGYGEYLQRNQIADGKIDTLRAIAARESTVEGFLDRLDRLQEIVSRPQKDLQDQKAGSVILSTIHSSKGLEYDEVYLLDVIDGIFPESIPKEWGKLAQAKDKKKDRAAEPSAEVIAYEEERRLFYVAMTRAKERLYLFKTFQKSTFCDEVSERMSH